MRYAKSLTPSLLCLILVSVAGLAPAVAQEEEPKRHQLTSDEVTADRLIDILQPKVEKPAALKTRSLEMPKPKCDFYDKKLSRGIGLEPVADIPAIQILFEVNSAKLSSSATQSLDALGKALNSADLAPCCFKLEGHTDSTGADAYNLKLSAARAASVADYLAKNHGVQLERLLTEGKGEATPIADNATKEGRTSNRRVEIINLGYGEF